VRVLEDGIIQGRNAAAKDSLRKDKLRELAHIERERLRADETLCQLLDEAAAERATIARLRERRREYEAAIGERIAALEQREQLLAAACAASESQVVERLAELNTADPDSLDHVLEQLGLFERAEVA
jgi:septal ring factor EnvC (AmiA/AmiB activator)